MSWEAEVLEDLYGEYGECMRIYMGQRLNLT